MTQQSEAVTVYPSWVRQITGLVGDRPHQVIRVTELTQQEAHCIARAIKYSMAKYGTVKISHECLKDHLRTMVGR